MSLFLRFPSLKNRKRLCCFSFPSPLSPPQGAQLGISYYTILSRRVEWEGRGNEGGRVGEKAESRSLCASIAQPQVGNSGAGAALLHRRRQLGPQLHPGRRTLCFPNMESHIHTSLSTEILPLKTTFIPLDLQFSKQVPTVGV